MINVKAFAKINLFLDITGKLDNGYHSIESVMQSVSLCDDVLIQRRSNAIRIECDVPEIPCDERNIAYKAACAVFDAVKENDRGVLIRIKKRIPHEAGLGGGSSDAAAVIAALNEVYSYNLSIDELCEIGKTVGADVPFCICGGTMVAKGIGEELTGVSALPDCFIVIAKPFFGVSTPKAYGDYDGLLNPEKRNMQDFVAALNSGDIDEISKSMFNAFEQVVHESDLGKIKVVMNNHGALGTLMSGSGSALFGIFKDEQQAKKCKNELLRFCKSAFISKPQKCGLILKTE